MSVELPGEVASLGRRAGAITIDWFASSFVALLIFPGTQWGHANAALPLEIVFYVEITVLTWLFASSFGQRLLGVRVVAMDGSRLVLWRVAVRTALICLVIPAVIFDSQGRGLHDRAVGSVVLRRMAS
ncbi:MAG: RDD family protein [Candidatus Nanopelagicales bacterium]